jgi:parallel beta-helix repeat protein
MKSKAKSVMKLLIALFMIFLAMVLSANSKVAEAQTSITIQTDGSISPVGATITTVDRTTYTLTSDVADNIIVQKNDIIIDGNGHNLNGFNVSTTYGITLNAVKNVTIQNMHITGYSVGVLIEYSNQTIVTKSSIKSAYGYGIWLLGSNNSTISENNLTNSASNGLLVWTSSNNLITGNNVTSNNAMGIALDKYSTNNTISQNFVANNTNGGIGISTYSTNNIVSENNVTLNTGTGVFTAYSSTGCTIGKNNVISNLYTHIGTPGYGIDAQDSNTLITGNNITGNVASGIRIAGINTSVIGNSLISNDLGITVAYLYSVAQNETISGNNITSNVRYGIFVQGYSAKIAITGNIISNCSNGIWLDSYANNSTITGNQITLNNGYGIVLAAAWDNTIYHNCFTGNKVQALTTYGNNTWDNGYPSGGNYWSDYTGADYLKGPLQNVLGADGIGDTSYNIDATTANIDRYPFLTIMFNQTGVGSDFPGIILQVDTNDYTVAQVPVSFMWNTTSTHSYGFHSPLITQLNTKRYVWVNTDGASNAQTANSLSMLQYGTITGNYLTQFLINVNASAEGANGGSFQITYTQTGTVHTSQLTTTPWSGWVDAGTTVSVTNPQQLIRSNSDPTGTQYLFNTYIPAQTLEADAPKNLTLNYIAQYYLAVSSAYSTPTGSGWYNENTIAYATLPTGTLSGTVGTRYVFTSWTGNATGTDFTKSNPLIMDKAKTAIASWKTQNQLSFNSTPTGGGSTIPVATNQWFDSGTIQIVANANSGYRFSQWLSSTPSITFSNTNTSSTSATIAGPGTITANFTLIPPGITITTSPGSISIAVDGVQYLAPQTFLWSIGTTHTIAASSQVSGTPGTQYLFVSWSDGGSQIRTYNVTTATATLNANYKTQYQIVFASTPSNAGTTNPTTTWLDPGSLQITAIPTSQYQFLQWTNSTNAITFANQNSNSTIATIIGSGTITAIFTPSPTPNPISTPTPTFTPTPSSPNPTPNPTIAPTPTTTASPFQSPTVPEFPARLLMITAVLFTVTVLSVVRIAKKREIFKIQNY